MLKRNHGWPDVNIFKWRLKYFNFFYFQCHCDDGWGGKYCEEPDLNECKYRPCSLFAHCTNTLGSFYCTCRPGYSGDGFECRPEIDLLETETHVFNNDTDGDIALGGGASGRGSICTYNGVEYLEVSVASGGALKPHNICYQKIKMS